MDNLSTLFPSIALWEQGSLTKTIPIPQKLVADKNTVKFQFNGHYARECEARGIQGLWAIIDNASSLKLTVNRFPLKNNLSHFPYPYIDDQSIKKGMLPFSFIGNVDRNTPRSCRIVSLLFRYVGIRYP
jgi:hypothetical protein